ncbi:hypothetical protein Agub_g15672 [Astrephomene gubernaculifera]|uniref:Uncharacterized protein n=1 Tax=Astrephomene gubernaculifera TaxID=47775 RepID=A0AAD3HTW2_9CHLO|nr:hypothetical protein Agub_g15672 [Astrephomene gubernaculifera]
MRRSTQLIARGGRFRSTISALPEEAEQGCVAIAVSIAALPPQVAATAAAPSLAAATLTGAGSPLLTQTRGFAASGAGARRGGSGIGGEAPREVVEADEAARRVMSDPMSRLMASQGMPVGLSFTAGTAAAAGAAAGAAGGGGRRGKGPVVDESEEGPEEDLTRPPRAEPAYQMEAFSDMLRATAASARRNPTAAATSSSSSGSGDEGFLAGVQQVSPSLDDSWGTTRESPAEIARRIVESNSAMAAAAGRAGGLAEEEGEEEDDGPDVPMTLSPSEEKYKSLEAMSADIKKLDEVFEVLASVPWLDEDVLAEKELKGVAQVGLLGTLEEVGFNIQPQLHRIWSGEHGAEMAAEAGLEFRDQAALMAILYHTQQILDKYGPPPRGYLPKPRQ